MATSTGSFAKSQGPGRHNNFDRSQTQRSGRPGHVRSKSQYARPQTSHAHRREELEEDKDTSNGTMLPPKEPIESLHRRKLRQQTRTTKPPPNTPRDSSLITGMRHLNINDRSAGRSQAISRTSSATSFRSSASSETPFPPVITNIPSRRPNKCNKENVCPAAPELVASQA